MAKSRKTKTQMPTAATQVRTAAAEIVNPLPLQAVAARAYQLYVERGCVDGHDLEDWIEAERQIRTEWAQSRGLPS